MVRRDSVCHSVTLVFELRGLTLCAIPPNVVQGNPTIIAKSLRRLLYDGPLYLAVFCSLPATAGDSTRDGNDHSFTIWAIRIRNMWNRTQTLLLLASLSLSGTASADQFTDAMISTKKVDFGVVATGSEVQKFIEIRNVHREAYVVREVKSSCACFKTQINKTTIAPGDTALVVVQMNTRNYRQRRDASLSISFAAPRFAEVRVDLTGYIRTDVVFNPGKVQFGEVELGTEGKAVVDIAYAGRNDWDIDDIKITNRNLKAVLEPGVRGNGQVNYKLTMSLSKDTPVGRIRDMIIIVTNDRSNPNVPLMIDGVVTPDISITPPVVNVGSVIPGQTKLSKILVRGKKPFQIAEIDCKDMSDCFKADLSKDSRQLHQVPIEFTVPNRPGKFSEELIVKITGRREPLRVNVTGVIAN